MSSAIKISDCIDKLGVIIKNFIEVSGFTRTILIIDDEGNPADVIWNTPMTIFSYKIDDEDFALDELIVKTVNVEDNCHIDLYSKTLRILDCIIDKDLCESPISYGYVEDRILFPFCYDIKENTINVKIDLVSFYETTTILHIVSENSPKLISNYTINFKKILIKENTTTNIITDVTWERLMLESNSSLKAKNKTYSPEEYDVPIRDSKLFVTELLDIFTILKIVGSNYSDIEYPVFLQIISLDFKTSLCIKDQNGKYYWEPEIEGDEGIKIINTDITKFDIIDQDTYQLQCHTIRAKKLLHDYTYPSTLNFDDIIIEKEGYITYKYTLINNGSSLTIAWYSNKEGLISEIKQLTVHNIKGNFRFGVNTKSYFNLVITGSFFLDSDQEIVCKSLTL